jgi:hypothetical protein
LFFAVKVRQARLHLKWLRLHPEQVRLYPEQARLHLTVRVKKFNHSLFKKIYHLLQYFQGHDEKMMDRLFYWQPPVFLHYPDAGPGPFRHQDAVV